jgi:hypothetical protein
MDKEKRAYLNVKTVPALEPVTHQAHTAYTVYLQEGNTLNSASGWTLRDAIELFARSYNHSRESLRLKRPFRPQ